MAEDREQGADDEPEVEGTFLDPARRSERGELHPALSPSPASPGRDPRGGRPPSDSGPRVPPPHDTFPAGQPIESTLRAVPVSAAEAVQRIGPFELRRVLGKGGMGVVYEAYHPEQGQTRALKVISSADVDREELARFDREARAVQKLEHPNIVAIHDVGLDSGRPYFTMDLVEGTNLQALARSGEALTPRRSAELVATVAEAIHYAHEQGIIHRDLKPANILIDPAGIPHVTDFGLAKDLGEASVGNLTLTGVAMGSPPYMPPEQARGLFRQVDAVSDVYGLGAVLYECLTGRPPFRGKSLYDVIAQVLTQEPLPPSKVRPEVPPALETICLKALEKEKWRRYASAQAMQRDLQRFLRGEAVRAVRGGLTTRIGRRVAQHRHLVAALLPLFVIAALLTYAFGPRKPSFPPLPEVPPSPEPELLLSAAQAVQRGVGYVPLVEALGSLEAPDWWAVFPGAGELEEGNWKLLRGELGDLRGELQPVQLKEILDLLVRDRELKPERARALLSDLVRDTHYEFARPLQQAFLAGLGRARQAREPFELALADAKRAPTPLDRAVLECALDNLKDEADRRAVRACVPRALAAYVDAFQAPVLRPGGYVKSRPTSSAAQDWRWPPAPQRGLCRAWGSATHPLLSLDGRWVYVGWLRFVYTLASDDGRVCGRTRLPGVARSLRYSPRGGVEVEVEAAEVRSWVTLRLGPGPEAIVDPPFAPSLTPEPLRIPVDELRWLARARFPACDPGIEVEPRGATGPWRFYPYAPPSGPARCGAIDLGVKCRDGRRLVLGEGLVVPPDSFASRALSSDEQLLRISPPLPGVRDAYLLSLVGRPKSVPVRPKFIPAHPQDPSLEPLLDDAALFDEGNPWVLAYAAALRSELEGAPPVGTLVERALGSPLLTGAERIALVRYLHAHGLSGLEHGADLVLRDLDAAGWAPDWSGTGPLDPWVVAEDEALVRRGLATLGAPRAAAPGALGPRGLVWAEAGHAFQQSLIPGALGLLLLLWMRYRRQTRRDLERSGVRGRAARARLWIANPRVRLSFAWPSYVTLHDKAAVGATLALYFVLVGLNDAAREALTASRRGPQALCGGYPTSPASCSALDLAFRSYRRRDAARLSPEAPPEQGAAFAALSEDVPAVAATVASRCGLDFAEAERALEALTAAGALERSAVEDPQLAYARAWAKQRARRPDQEVRAAYRDALAIARTAPALLGLAQQLADDPQQVQALVEEARELDPELVAFSLTPPMPSLAARDLALLGRERWWTAWPARTLRALFVPVPGRIDASLLAFERAYDRPLRDQRARNRWFWMVPFVLLLVLGSMLLPSPRYFEPVTIDGRPSFLVRVVGPLVPGVAQVMTGRPLRGAGFVFVWLFAVDVFLRSGPLWNVDLLGLDLSEASEATGHSPQAVLDAVGGLKRALAGVLAGVYVLHVLDLRGLRRRLRVAFEEDVESRVASLWEIPLDSTLASRGDAALPIEREEPGPFDDSMLGGNP
ncbi:MAG: protein kinase [Planctomycetes bacterium]|nr:protein kinase [Planctomycetota bacterium]